MSRQSRGYAVRLAAAVAAAAVVAGGLGGCTPDPKPSTSPSASASSPSGSVSPSVSPSPSASPSVSIPPEASVQTPEGAVAFVKFYFDQVNKAWMTPDASLLPPLGEPACKSCTALQADALEFTTLARRYSSLPVEVLNVEGLAGAPLAQQLVSVRMRQLPADVVDKAGAVVETRTDETFDRKVLLGWREGRWWIVDIG